MGCSASNQARTTNTAPAPAVVAPQTPPQSQPADPKATVVSENQNRKTPSPTPVQEENKPGE